MRPYFFPLLFLLPAPGWDSVEDPPFKIARRLWQTSVFDLATLATRHKLHLPYQVMDVMLARCNVEVCIEADSLDDAAELLNVLLLGLYTENVSPTVAPFSTTYSVNQYSGINGRDSDSLRSQLPDGLKSGLMSDTATLEAWPVHLSFSCHVLPERCRLSIDMFRAAAQAARSWTRVESSAPELRVVREAAQSAPLLSSRDQSLLHIWCALEALFPRVSAELSFRIALYLTQLVRANHPSEYFASVRKAYGLRSQVAHGARRGVSAADWCQAWDLLMSAAKSVLRRGALPDEDDLLSELLPHPAQSAVLQTKGDAER